MRKKQELCDDRIGDIVIDDAAQKYDAIAQQAGVNVICSLSVGAFFDYGWN